jgi:hypothetical protein
MMVSSSVPALSLRNVFCASSTIAVSLKTPSTFVSPYGVTLDMRPARHCSSMRVMSATVDLPEPFSRDVSSSLTYARQIDSPSASLAAACPVHVVTAITELRDGNAT